VRSFRAKLPPLTVLRTAFAPFVDSVRFRAPALLTCAPEVNLLYQPALKAS